VSRGSLLGVATVCAALAFGVAGASSSPLPRVTLIGDSVSSAIALDPGATAILRNGVDLQLQAQACRRLEAVSCPEDNGTVPPTALALIHSLGHALGSNVIVAVGYNDPEDEYASELQDVLAALHQQGVQHILWVTLRAARHPYVTMNDDIRAAAAADPSVTVVDWNVYSRSHPEWFQADGIHLAGDGAQAMASLMHTWLVHLKIAPAALTVGTQKLPNAHAGERYSTPLAAAGGTPPYRWAPVSLPAGFAVTRAGLLMGRPGAHATVLHLTVRVTDASGARAARSLVLHVLR
jgi:hypothetical protein